MTFEDSFKLGRNVKAQAQKSLDRAKEALERDYGVVRTERSGKTVTVTYGPGGRAAMLDAAALAYEIEA